MKYLCGKCLKGFPKINVIILEGPGRNLEYQLCDECKDDAMKIINKRRPDCN